MVGRKSQKQRNQNISNSVSFAKNHHLRLFQPQHFFFLSFLRVLVCFLILKSFRGFCFWGRHWTDGQTAPCPGPFMRVRGPAVPENPIFGTHNERCAKKWVLRHSSFPCTVRTLNPNLKTCTSTYVEMLSPRLEG